MGWEKVVEEVRRMLIELPINRFLVLAVLTAIFIVAWAIKGK